jgi:Clp amino terminal domain, pathogenicity island component
MFLRYTDAAKRAIFFAHTEAMHRNEPSISTADILIGLTWEADSPPSSTSPLKELAVALRGAVGISHLPSTSLPYRREGAIPLKPDAKKAVAFAAAEADRDGQFWIDSDHLLRGLLSFDNEAKKALLSAGIDFEAARAASLSYRQRFPAPPIPVWRLVRLWVRRYRFPLLFLGIIILLLLVVKLRGGG